MSLMLPDFDCADRIGKFSGSPKTRTFAELLIDCEAESRPTFHRNRPVSFGKAKPTSLPATGGPNAGTEERDQQGRRAPYFVAACCLIRSSLRAFMDSPS